MLQEINVWSHGPRPRATEVKESPALGRGSKDGEEGHRVGYPSHLHQTQTVSHTSPHFFLLLSSSSSTFQACSHHRAVALAIPLVCNSLPLDLQNLASSHPSTLHSNVMTSRLPTFSHQSPQTTLFELKWSCFFSYSLLIHFSHQNASCLREWILSHLPSGFWYTTGRGGNETANWCGRKWQISEARPEARWGCPENKQSLAAKWQTQCLQKLLLVQHSQKCKSIFSKKMLMHSWADGKSKKTELPKSIYPQGCRWKNMPNPGGLESMFEKDMDTGNKAQSHSLVKGQTRDPQPKAEPRGYILSGRIQKPLRKARQPDTGLAQIWLRVEGRGKGRGKETRFPRKYGTIIP